MSVGKRGRRPKLMLSHYTNIFYSSDPALVRRFATASKTVAHVSAHRYSEYPIHPPPPISTVTTAVLVTHCCAFQSTTDTLLNRSPQRAFGRIVGSHDGSGPYAQIAALTPGVHRLVDRFAPGTQRHDESIAHWKSLITKDHL
ncbi:Ff.00g130970.m01.CDS01 [Fusarium sp. VM40]|nr:Ff.00g130970.m01.CDS01 [Fusarium sp. VM40]